MPKLTNGIINPVENSTDWYEDLAQNWTALDGHLGAKDLHVTAAEKAGWTRTGTDLSAHKADLSVHLGDGDREAIARAAEAAGTVEEVSRTAAETSSALAAHTGDSSAHLSEEDRAKLAGAAADSAVVHKTGNETVAGVKTFSNLLYMSSSATTTGFVIKPLNLTQGTPPAETITQCYRVVDASNKVVGEFSFQAYAGGDLRAYIRVSDGAHDRRVALLLTAAGAVSFSPANTADGINLGDSGHKWKTLNGVNPGALCFPLFSKAINIKEELADTAKGVKYTPPATGFVCIHAAGATRITCVNGWCGAEGTEWLFTPVAKGVAHTITVTGGTLTTAYFVPTQGNPDVADLAGG